MAKQSVGLGTTGRIEYIYIIDSLSSTGLGKTGLVYNTSGLTCYYVRNAAAASVVNLITQTSTGSWVSGGFSEIDQTNMPGIYRVDLPDAVFASGSDKAIVMIKGAANTIPVTLEYQLTAADPNNFTTASIASSTWTFASRTVTGGAVTSVVNNVDITTTSMSGIANSVWTNPSRSITSNLDKNGYTVIAGVVTSVPIQETSYVGIATSVWQFGIRTITGGTLTTNNDKTGYVLSQAFPANFSSLSITGGKVSIVQSDLDYITSHIPEVNYTNIASANWNYLMSGIATSGTFGYQIKVFLDATVSSRSTLTSNQVLEAIKKSTMTTAETNKEIFSKLP